MRYDNKAYIGLLTSPLSRASMVPLSNLVEILISISTKLTLITGNEGYTLYNKERRFTVYGVNYAIDNSVWKIPRYLNGQIRSSILLIKNSKHSKCWIIFGGQSSIIPIITAKLLGKKVVVMMLGSAIRDSLFSQDKFLKIIKILSSISLSLADNIIIYSPNLIQDWGLEPYRNKIIIAHRHFLDFETFTVTTLLPDRPPLIGYIGRLSGEKGVQHFARALPAILSDWQDLRVLIGGEGQLKDSIVTCLQEEGIAARVDLPGWISHDNLPRYLNQIRLLVLPSYTEGLPNIMLEAMACGTPVLATSVGAVPDVIIDGKTGFIMENNSPECIAENVVRALEHPDLEQIAEAGRRFVEENFTFERVVERWKEVLDEI